MRGLRAGLGLGCVLAAGCLAPSPAQAAPAAPLKPGVVRPLDVHGPLGDERLSDERRVSRYAGAVAGARVRTLPSTSARQVGRLHYRTEDGPFEVYPVLESHIDAGGRGWLRIRLPMRPNGHTGWVPASDLGSLHAVRTDRPELIPGRPSHGCIRVPNSAIRRLWQPMPVGTPVRIL